MPPSFPVGIARRQSNQSNANQCQWELARDWALIKLRYCVRLWVFLLHVVCTFHLFFFFKPDISDNLMCWQKKKTVVMSNPVISMRYTCTTYVSTSCTVHPSSPRFHKTVLGPSRNLNMRSASQSRVGRPIGLQLTPLRLRTCTRLLPNLNIPQDKNSEIHCIHELLSKSREK